MGKLPKRTNTKTFYGKRWHYVGGAVKKGNALDLTTKFVSGKYKVVKVQPTKMQKKHLSKKQKHAYAVYTKKKQ